MEKSDFVKMPVLEKMVVSMSSPNNDLENKVKIESEVLEGDQHSTELATFICQPDLDIKQDFEGDRTEMSKWTEENRTNEIHSNDHHSYLTIAAEVKELDIFKLSLRIEELEEDKVKIESEVLDFEGERTELLQWTDENHTNEIYSKDLSIPAETKKQHVFDHSSQIEELEEDKVKIEPKTLEDDQHSIKLTTFIRQPDLDIKQDFEDDSDHFFDQEPAINFKLAHDVPDFLLQTNDDSNPPLKSSTKQVASSPLLIPLLPVSPSAQSLKPKAKQLILTSGNHSKRTLVLTVIPKTDTKKPNRKCSKTLVDMMKSSLFNLLHKGQEYNINELVPAYNCEDDGFPSCPFKTLYFEEYLKHVDTIRHVGGLRPFSSSELQRKTIMEGWLAREVGPFQCKYCKKATVTYLEMEKHQAVSHAQKQCYIYYRKFVPNDTVTVPEQVNLEDSSFINHVIHLPDQIHLYDLKVMDNLLSSTSQSPVREPENSDQQKISLNDSGILSLPTDNECKWESCHQTYDSHMALVEHIKENHLQSQSGKQFTCLWNNCSRKLKPFNGRLSLLLHLRIHTGERPYKCLFQGCNKTFSRGNHLKFHQKGHMGDRPYQCQFPNCFKMFSGISEKKHHQRLHYNPCKWKGCYQTYDSQTARVKHIKKNHIQMQSGKEFICSWNSCPRKSKPFNRKRDLLNHMRTHTGERPYKCAFQGCNEVFAELVQLKIHKRRHTGGRPYQCQFSNCFKRFSTIYAKDTHQRLHYNPESYACQVTGCSKKYNHLCNLRIHMKTHTVVEQIGSRWKLIQSKEKGGDLVLKKSSNSLNGAKHQKTHYDSCKWEGCCQICNSKMAFVKHIETDHVQLQSGKQFTCLWNNCPRKSKPFYKKFNLLLHMNSHTGERPYKCPFQGCNKAFSRLDRLTAHYRGHTGERPYQCQFSNCLKMFPTIYERNYHQRLHYNPESYACQVTGCLKKFNRPSNLRTHMKTHTVEEQIESKQKLVQNKEKGDDLVLKKSSKSSNGAKKKKSLRDKDAHLLEQFIKKRFTVVHGSYKRNIYLYSSNKNESTLSRAAFRNT